MNFKSLSNVIGCLIMASVCFTGHYAYIPIIYICNAILWIVLPNYSRGIPDNFELLSTKKPVFMFVCVLNTVFFIASIFGGVAQYIFWGGISITFVKILLVSTLIDFILGFYIRNILNKIKIVKPLMETLEKLNTLQSKYR